ncbi:MAG: hypothetical protein FLDDKLPJ_00319 [Phycisphaerae bacterium]|nr:hypothetical protein [Phycisphaerae bacterium]
MTATRYVLRGLAHRRSTSLTVALGVAVGASALIGALIVGDSMRGSLREHALKRLGGVTHALIAPRFFRAGLASVLPDAGVADDARLAPAILLTGGAEHAESRRRSNGAQIFGVEAGFFRTVAPEDVGGAKELLPGGIPGSSEPEGCLINAVLASDLGVRTGDELLLHFARPGDAPAETLLGRRDDTTAALRLPVRGIAPDEAGGGLSLRPRQKPPRNVFVPLHVLQRALRRDGAANVLLVRASGSDSDASDAVTAPLTAGLRSSVTPEDVGIRIRTDEARRIVSIESDRLLIDPATERVAEAAIRRLGASATRVLAYLANDVDATQASVPYSTAAGLDAEAFAWGDFRDAQGRDVGAPGDDGALLNAWTAEQLGALPGDTVTLRYFVAGGVGELLTRERAFRVVGVIEMNEAAADAGFVPEYPGITNVRRLTDWNPPFPFDFRKVRDADEAYWDEHRAAPKIFLNLAAAQAMWATEPDRHGRLTSIRLRVPEGKTPAAFTEQVRAALTAAIDPAEFGLLWRDVRGEALAAARGTTDFSQLFLGFSFFLIAAAAMLAALLFRLSVERRLREIGVLAATGFAPSRIRGMLLSEGAVLAGAGSVAGLLGAAGYAWGMLSGLRTWWSAAANAPFLSLHVEAATAVIGVPAAALTALLSMMAALRGALRESPRRLLSGALPETAPGGGPSRLVRVFSRILPLTCAAMFVLAWLVRGTAAEAGAFFAVGSLTLIAGLSLARVRWRRRARLGARAGPGATLALAARNAARHPGRSMTTVALIASATFLVVSIQAFRQTPDDRDELAGAAGGFELVAECETPLPYDLAIPTGRESLGLAPRTRELLGGAQVFPFRLLSGDETSCTSLYVPTRPRILGVEERFMQRGAFAIRANEAPGASSSALWSLLNQPLDDGAVPVIGDENAVRWQLHSGLGREIVIEDEAGRPTTLRFVALLKGSVLQSELMIGDAAFRRLFPTAAGHAFFLIDVPGESASALATALEGDLRRFSFDAEPVRVRLKAFLEVQNTYLSTFQAIGGFGLILGTFGLAVGTARNILERRSELALMRAVGYAPSTLRRLIVIEHLALALQGLLIGLAAAAAAVLPRLLDEPSSLRLWSAAGVAAAIGLVTWITCTRVTRQVARDEIVAALRRE